MRKLPQLVYHPEAEKELDQATAWYHEKSRKLNYDSSMHHTSKNPKRKYRNDVCN